MKARSRAPYYTLILLAALLLLAFTDEPMLELVIVGETLATLYLVGLTGKQKPLTDEDRGLEQWSGN